MLLLDDDDELPEDPDDAEAQLVQKLGPGRLERIDEALRNHVQARWLKVARVVADAVKDGGFSITDENVVRVHVRRAGALVESGVFEGQGDLRKPRWSEVRIAQGHEDR